MDVQQVMGIPHFEELMKIFQEADKRGKGGLTIDEVRITFREITSCVSFGKHLGPFSETICPWSK